MKSLFLHLSNCSPDEVAMLRGLVGRSIAITEAPLRPGSLKNQQADFSAVVRDVNALPSNLDHGEGTLVILELLTGGDGDSGQ